MTTTSRPGPQARPILIAREDFVRLMDLAYRNDPLKGLARQVAAAIGGVNERTVERWLTYEQTPPPRIIADALPLAKARHKWLSGVTDRTQSVLEP